MRSGKVRDITLICERNRGRENLVPTTILDSALSSHLQMAVAIHRMDLVSSAET